MPNAMLNGINLYYECYGNGEPLMLIAGLASDSQSWLPIIEKLSRSYRLILPDNRGTGRTTPRESETSIQQMADDCIALMDHLNLPSASLTGHSMGGFVALDCAIRHPERIDKLILAATSASNSARNNSLFNDWASSLINEVDIERWFRNLFYWICTRSFFANPETVNAAIRYAVDYPYPQSQPAFLKQVEAIEAFNCKESLSGIKQETLILCGEDDLLFPPNESIEILEAIPNTSTSLIEGAAHSIHMENPEAFIKCVLEFLGKG